MSLMPIGANAECHEKIWTIAGPEFGITEKGIMMTIKRALYGLKGYFDLKAG